MKKYVYVCKKCKGEPCKLKAKVKKRNGEYYEPKNPIMCPFVINEQAEWR